MALCTKHLFGKRGRGVGDRELGEFIEYHRQLGVGLVVLRERVRADGGGGRFNATARRFPGLVSYAPGGFHPPVISRDYDDENYVNTACFMRLRRAATWIAMPDPDELIEVQRDEGDARPWPLLEYLASLPRSVSEAFLAHCSLLRVLPNGTWIPHTRRRSGLLVTPASAHRNCRVIQAGKSIGRVSDTPFAATHFVFPGSLPRCTWRWGGPDRPESCIVRADNPGGKRRGAWTAVHPAAGINHGSSKRLVAGWPPKQIGSAAPAFTNATLRESLWAALAGCAEGQVPVAAGDALLVANIESDPGLGMQLLLIARLAAYAGAHGLALHAALVGDLRGNRAYRAFGHGRDVLEYAFARAQPPAPHACAAGRTVRAARWGTARAAVAAQLAAAGRRLDPEASRSLGFDNRGEPANLTRCDAAAALLGGLEIERSLADLGCAFWQGAALHGGCVVGVHYRGKDKVDNRNPEAVRMAFDDVLRPAGAAADRLGCTRFLVASDEPAFELAAEAWAAERGAAAARLNLTVQCGAGCRSLHYHSGTGANFAKTREAVLTMLLLSWTDHLVKTASLFSAVSAVLNPRLPVTLVSRPSKYTRDFPEMWFGADFDGAPLPGAPPEPPRCAAAERASRAALCAGL